MQQDKKQHPADTVCPHCRTRVQRTGSTHISIVYSCACGYIVSEKSKPPLMRKQARIGRAWTGGNDAA